MTSVEHSKAGVTAPSNSTGYVTNNNKTIDDIKHQSNILGKSFGFKLTKIDLFWRPLELKDLTSASVQDESPASFMKEVRPPDSIFGFVNLRKCHVGLILLAESQISCMPGADKVRLAIVVHLLAEGIKVHFQLGHEDALQIALHNAKETDVYSAGVSQELHLEIDDLCKAVEEFVHFKYSLVAFNCQTFASLVYYRLTGRFLNRMIRKRWTCQYGWNDFIGRPSDDLAELLMKWASGVKELEGLYPVNVKEFEYGQSPALVGKPNHTTLICSVLVAAVDPLVAASVLLAGLVIEQYPQLRTLAKSTIWFKYNVDTDEWFWSPYRDREIDSNQRWISVNEVNISVGSFKGQSVKGKSLGTIQYLKDHNPCPWDEKVCEICFEGIRTATQHEYCSNCFVNMQRQELVAGFAATTDVDQQHGVGVSN